MLSSTKMLTTRKYAALAGGDTGLQQRVDDAEGDGMKHLARRASLVVALLLLASVGTASAECAWVLWTYISSSASDKAIEERWRPLSSYATQAGCQEDQQKMRQRSSERAAAPGIRLVTHQCFPDTVDPRGPKGR